MKKVISVLMILAMMVLFASMASVNVFAEAAEEVVTEATADEGGVLSAKAIAAAVTIAVVGAAGAVGMAWAIAKSAEGMARQPEAAGKINSAMMLGLVFIETAIIYALIVAILIIFVL